MKANGKIFDLINGNVQELTELVMTETSTNLRTCGMYLYHEVSIRYVRNIERESNVLPNVRN